MKYQLSYNSIIRLRSVLIENQLLGSFADVKDNIKKGIKINVEICQRNAIEKYIRLGEATTEIRNRARRNLGAQRADKDIKGWKKEIKRLWQMRLTQKNRDIRILNRQWWDQSDRISRILPRPVLAEFKAIKAEELQRDLEQLTKLEDR